MKRNAHAGRTRREGVEFRVLTDDDLADIHLGTLGYEGHFYQKTIIYYDEAGMVYWTMGAPLDETIIINRCRKEDTYEERLKRGALP